MEKETLELLVQLRRSLHRHPELSGQEHWTKQHLMEFLQGHTTLTLEDRGGWFFAVYHSGSTAPAIAFRADYDAIAMEEGIALPHASQNAGAAHKCGHDGHAAILAGLALEVERRGAGRDVYFLFQPAEENGQGAAECTAMLREHPEISEIYALHNMPGYPLGGVALREGTMCCASVGVRLEFTGEPAHASQPETGRSPVPAMAAVAAALEDIASPARYRGLVLCTVVYMQAGEKAFGIAAGRGSLWVTCRGQYQEEMDEVVRLLEEKAATEAEAHGLRLSIGYQEAFPETANQPFGANRVREACRSLGIPLTEMDKPFRSSEDFGHLLQMRQGAMFFLGAGDSPDLHTFAYDFLDELIPTGVAVFMALI